MYIFTQLIRVEIYFFQHFFKNVQIFKVKFKYQGFIEPFCINQSLNVSTVYAKLLLVLKNVLMLHV